jgi:hypothetical protein
LGRRRADHGRGELTRGVTRRLDDAGIRIASETLEITVDRPAGAAGAA